MIKLIASDMDGTVLNENRRISPENAAAIKAAQQSGILFVIATGRSYKEAVHILQAADITCPMICVNGAEIRSAMGEKIKSIPLNQEQYRAIGDTLRDVDIYYEIYTNTGVCSDNPEKAIKVIADIIRSANPEQSVEDARNLAERRFKRGEIRYTPDYDELLEEQGIEIYKVLAFSMDSEKLQQAWHRLEEQGTLAVSSSGNHNIEITDRRAQKGLALKEFAAANGISLEETMALGDHFNDISMLSIVGYGVAMGNAEDEIKSVCSYTTAPNTENGVARAIYELALAK